jgi:hypothetical protein
VPVVKRRARKPILRTPAMRHGIQAEERDPSGRLKMPSLHRVLYRPWLYAGTPLFAKFDDDRIDLRRRKSAPVPRSGRTKRTVRMRDFVRSPQSDEIQGSTKQRRHDSATFKASAQPDGPSSTELG